MLTKNWRVLLLLVATVFTVWPGLFGKSLWLVVGALVILLVGEFTDDNCAASSKGKKKK